MNQLNGEDYLYYLTAANENYDNSISGLLAENTQDAIDELAAGLGGGGYTDEQAQDAVGAMLVDTNSIDLTYVDATPALSADLRIQDTATVDLGIDASGLKASVIADSSTQKVEITKNGGAVVGTRKKLNFIEGDNFTLTITDDAGGNKVDIEADILGLILAASANNSNIRTGSLELQAPSTSSSLVMNNMYWDGGTFRYRANGEASGIHFDGDEIRFMRASSGLAAADAGGYGVIPTPLIIRASSIDAAVDITVPSEAYSSSWNGSNEVPTKNDVYDKIESLAVPTYGTYTPTLTDEQLLTSSTAYSCQYARIGDMVIVSGMVETTPSGISGLAVRLGISLPVASNLTAENQLGGSAANQGTNPTAARIHADSTNDRARLTFSSTGTGSITWSFCFMYRII